MIPFHFDYYRPDTIEEAVQIYQYLDGQGKKPLYYSGGSEIISMARMNNISTRAVVDLKEIPECRMLEFEDGDLMIGASVTLSSLTESNLFPLLAKSCGRIADHTMQCKITVGGNVCGTIIYKETLLPFLLADCIVVTAGEGGIKKKSIHEIFHERLKLSKGEFIVQFLVERKFCSSPYFHIKKTKNEKIDYPLVSVAALLDSDRLKVAFSGLCEFPFRSAEVESELNDNSLPFETRISNSFQLLPASVMNDLSGSDRYRLFSLKHILLNIEGELRGQSHV